VADELRFTVGAREIYDEVKELRLEVKYAIDDYSGLQTRVGRLEKIVYGLVPIAGLVGYLINTFTGAA
jgi:hypothetical protein